MSRSHNFQDLTGMVFGRLTVISFAGKNKRGRTEWFCRCSCGKEKVVAATSLKSRTKSCGCLSSEIARKTNRKHWLPIDKGTYYQIPLNDGSYAKIDKEDLDKINSMSWSKSKIGYPICTYHRKNHLMHHIILPQLNKGEEIDHINHDVTDNRKSNLRICLHKDNMKNRMLSSNNTSGCAGVYYDKKNHRWYSRIIVDSKCIHLGSYKEKGKAINARKEAEIKFFGNFSILKSNIG